MKYARFLFLFLPLAAYSGPGTAAGTATAAVFDFKSDWNVDYHVAITDAGKSFAYWLAHDLSVLPPITVVDARADDPLLGHGNLDLSETLSPADARRVGQSLGATALVTGRIFWSGTEIIVAAKVVSTETGEALGTAVNGGPSTPLADIVSQLSEQVGKIVLLQKGLEHTTWSPATITGTRNLVPTVVPNTPRQDFTGIVSIDGRAVPYGPDAWSLEQPIRPGSHAVVIYYFEGISGFTHRVIFDVRPGASYQVTYDRVSKLCIRDLKTGQPVKSTEASVLASRSKGNTAPVHVTFPDTEGPSGNYPQIGSAPNSQPFGPGAGRSMNNGHK